MYISWLTVVPSLLALFFPLDRLLGDRVRLQTVEGLHGADGSPRGRQWWFVPALWFDPLRAFLGAYGLMMAIQLSENAKGMERLLPWAIITGVLVAAISVQMLTRREDDRCLAPVAFAIGLVMARLPLTVSIPAVVLGIASVLAFRALAAFFLLSSVAILGLGFLHMGKDPSVIATAIITAWPLVFVLILQKIFVVPARR